MALSIIEEDEDLTLGAGGDFFVCVWKHRTTLDGLALAEKKFKVFASTRTRPLGLVTIVTESAPAPGREERKAIAKMLGGFADDVCASAVVFEGGGLRASTVRGVVAAVNIISHPPYPHRVFASVLDAMVWMVPVYINPLLGTSHFPDQVSRQIEKLRGRATYGDSIAPPPGAPSRT